MKTNTSAHTTDNLAKVQPSQGKVQKYGSGSLDHLVEAQHPLSDLYAKWDALGDVPIDDDDCIEEVFLDFGVGTHREEIWNWFERQHPQFIVGNVKQGIRHHDHGNVPQADFEDLSGDGELEWDVCRMDDLVGKDFKILAFRDLQLSHQLAIAHYMTLDGDAEGETPASLEALLSAHLLHHGDDEWGVLNVAAERLKQSVMADEDRASGNESWEQYAAAYCAAGDVPHYDSDDRWPVLLSADNYETLLDGWHRMHSYMRSGAVDVPAIFAPEERHYELIGARKGNVHEASENSLTMLVSLDGGKTFLPANRG